MNPTTPQALVNWIGLRGGGGVLHQTYYISVRPAQRGIGESRLQHHAGPRAGQPQRIYVDLFLLTLDQTIIAPHPPLSSPAPS